MQKFSWGQVVTIVTAAILAGGFFAAVKANTSDINDLEVKQDKILEKVNENNRIGSVTSNNVDWIKKFLEKLDRD